MSCEVKPAAAKPLSPFARLLAGKRRARRHAQNERLRLAFDALCPIVESLFDADSGRRACRDGERELCEVLDRALLNRPVLRPAANDTFTPLWGACDADR